MKHALKYFFNRPNGPDLRNGVRLLIDGQTYLLHGKVGSMIQDERAHKFILSCKGATGIKPCCLCQNVVKPSSNLLPDPTGYCIPSTCMDSSRFHLHTHESIRSIQRRLKYIAENEPARLDGLEILLGFSFNAASILQDEDLDLRLPEVVAWDWMHCYMVGGTFERE
eukprot:4720370-Pyramimonas_sp.AAC.1